MEPAALRGADDGTSHSFRCNAGGLSLSERSGREPVGATEAIGRELPVSDFIAQQS